MWEWAEETDKVGKEIYQEEEILYTIGIKDKKVEKTVTELKKLQEQLNKISLKRGKEWGDCGAVYKALQDNKVQVKMVWLSMKSFINITIIFLNNLQKTLKTAEKNIENQIGGGN